MTWDSDSSTKLISFVLSTICNFTFNEILNLKIEICFDVCYFFSSFSSLVLDWPISAPLLYSYQVIPRITLPHDKPFIYVIGYILTKLRNTTTMITQVLRFCVKVHSFFITTTYYYIL
jgi:hypothetical protein